MSDTADCIFCRIVAGEIGQKIFEDDLVVAFDDLNPQAPTHILIVPKEHLVSINDLGESNENVAGRLLTTAARLARDKQVHDQGYRLVVNTGAPAGQSVFHLHVHLLSGRRFGWPPG